MYIFFLLKKVISIKRSICSTVLVKSNILHKSVYYYCNTSYLDPFLSNFMRPKIWDNNFSKKNN